MFCGLARWARGVEDGELVEWWPERRCTAEWGEVVRPDKFGTLRRPTRVVEFFVEVEFCSSAIQMASQLGTLTGNMQQAQAGIAPHRS